MAISKLTGAQIAALTLADAHISATAAIATSKLADGALFLKSDGSVAATAALSGVTPTLPAHFATKGYVDSVAVGLDTKQSVRAATTANIALTGTQTIDGVVLVAGDRVLVKNQTTASQNGIYVVAAGAWALATDADINAEVTTGLHTFVEQGTTLGGSGWVLTTAMPITIGSTALAFAQFSGAGTYSAGNGLALTGTQFNVVSGNGGIVSSSGQVALTLADSTLAITGSGLKLAPMTAGYFMVGNGSAIATGVQMSGDASLASSGAVTIGTGVISTAKLAANAVDETKMKRLTAAQLLVGQGVGADVLSVALSGDVTMAQTGAVTVGTGAISTAKLAANAVDLTKMARQTAGTLLVGQGAGADVQAVAMTGDVTISQAGVTVIGAGKVVAATLAANVVDETKIKRQTAGTIVVGQGAGVDVAAVAVSGDATMSQAGVFTIASTVVRIADFITNETPTGAINGSNTTFVLANTPRAALVVIYNGAIQEPGAGNDYTITGNTITTLFTASGNDKIRVNYIK